MGVVNHHDIINELAIRYGVSRELAHEIHDMYYQLIFNYLADGHDVVVNGILTYEHRHRAARPYHNPSTGEAAMSQPKDVIRVFNRARMHRFQEQRNALPEITDPKRAAALEELYAKWIRPKLEK